MVDRGVEADIAFIRSTLEEGRAYARRRSPDMFVWGLFVAAGYLGTYAYVRHWSSVDPNWVWLVAIAIPWAYSLRRWWFWLLGSRLARLSAARRRALSPCSGSAPASRLLTLAVAANWGGVAAYHWYDAAVAEHSCHRVLRGSFLCNVAWLRFVAVAWWIGALLLYGLRGDGVLLLGAAMMLLFLAGPGLILFLSARNAE